MTELGLPKKTLLLLDNAAGHPPTDELLTKYLPPNYTPLLQLMDQHVIQNIKFHYRKSLLLSIVASDLTNISDFLKIVNLQDVVFSLNDAWFTVNAELINKTWIPYTTIPFFRRKRRSAGKGERY